MNIFIFLVILVGFTITSVLSYRSNLSKFELDIERLSVLASQGLYHEIDTVFTKPIAVSQTMADDYFLKNFLQNETAHSDDPVYINEMKKYLLAYKEKYHYDSVFLASTATDRYYHFRGLDRLLPKDNPENNWYYAFVNGIPDTEINIDNDEVITENNDITVFINSKIKSKENKCMGVVGVGFKVTHMQQLLQSYETNYGLQAFLINPNGKIEISSSLNGYSQDTDFFDAYKFTGIKEQILNNKTTAQYFWYPEIQRKSYIAAQYIPTLGWYLVIDNDSTALTNYLMSQFWLNMFIIIIIISLVLFSITYILRKFGTEIIQSSVENERKKGSVFHEATKHLFDDIYEIDITHSTPANDITRAMFFENDVEECTTFDEALRVFTQNTVHESFRNEFYNIFNTESVLNNYQNAIETISFDCQLKNGFGAYYWARVIGSLYYSEPDESLRLFIYSKNINAEKRHEQHMAEMVEKDQLCGVYNKAATEKYIQNTLTSSDGHLFAFFIMDIDNFKSINDIYGHVIGDAVLSNFAAALKTSFRSGDIVGRIGGDEFAAFIPVISKEWAEQKAQSLLDNLSKEFHAHNRNCKVSVSIGLAFSPDNGETYEDLYAKADAALYYIKKANKGSYAVYQKDTTE